MLAEGQLGDAGREQVTHAMICLAAFGIGAALAEWAFGIRNQLACSGQTNSPPNLAAERWLRKFQAAKYAELKRWLFKEAMVRTQGNHPVVIVVDSSDDDSDDGVDYDGMLPPRKATSTQEPFKFPDDE
ncbi:hypothetical protein HGRIS_002975 [Hohenbuehelia grisea]|uniref:Uncharacterized protein n=1 Tax=Hohenbuehelia grisea TaxID=104357 RepID=A0ABR3JNG2_9AGAR